MHRKKKESEKMQTENYKQRALDVRRTARTNLAEIRKARLARKAEVAPASVVSAPVGGHVDEPFDLPMSADKSSEQVLAEPQIQADKDLQNIEEPFALGAIAALAVESRAEPLVRSAETHATGDAALVADAQVNEPASTNDHQNEKIASDENFECDLGKLPGAGPGLIWMLGQCGVSSLADLALCDNDELSERLGVVGELLDVQQWIRFAQDCTANREEPIAYAG
jgi:hypothetical protein